MGGDAGDDRKGEFLDPASGERTHIFDAFALVNVLLCSAHRAGTVNGASSPTMQKNCLKHFAATLRLLEPTVVVLQGVDVARWTSSLFQKVDQVDQNAQRVRFEGREFYLCRFTHPSARGEQQWGDTLEAPYLQGTVRPTLERVRETGVGSPMFSRANECQRRVLADTQRYEEPIRQLTVSLV